jgi:hypothetical protein
MGNVKRVIKGILGLFKNPRFFLVLILASLTVLAFAGEERDQTGRSHDPDSDLSSLFSQNNARRDLDRLEQALGRPMSRIWTETRSLSPYENAENHFIKHGWQAGHKSVADYVLAAHAFLKDPAGDIETRREPDGDVIRFRPRTGEFAVMRPDGTARTYYIRGQESGFVPGTTRHFDSKERGGNF